MIQHIQRESGAMCAIVSDATAEAKAGADTLWSPIVITGSPSKTIAAHDMIHDVVEGEKMLYIILSKHFLTAHYDFFCQKLTMQWWS